MTSLWTKFTAWLSGWPEGTKEDKKIKEDSVVIPKPKKSKGLNPKKKKRVKKQGNKK
ncbi:MAG: hypothetical protein MK200_04340 [Nitrosopumilus sp.]|nr:hypothetical protein [Nitrosopumilus sp.]